MDYWYNKSLVERDEVYSHAYHQQEQQLQKKATARDDHHLKRRALFQQRSEPLTQYQKQQQQHEQQHEQTELVTLAKRMTHKIVESAPPPLGLQRQVTKFW
jgi:hypothetical protein